ncbi:MAG: EF-Tu/IF-2/RF-3 family GTPase, partial [Patescibacteria group bacterium]
MPDAYKGKLAIGRIVNGTIHAAEGVCRIMRDGTQTQHKLSSLLTFEGLGRVETGEARAGDIVAFGGIPDVNIGDTITSIQTPLALPPITIEQPTVKMTLAVNTSPFAGRDGQYCTSRNLRERLFKELDTDVALRVEEGEGTDEFIVSGRGELHLSILIERMRREKYELQVSRPEVIMHEENGALHEPIEDVWIDVPEEHVGVIIEKLGRRKGELKNMHVENGIAQFYFTIPTRGLIGYRNEFLTDTKGLGIMNTLFSGFMPTTGDIESNSHGSLISFESGTSNTYGMLNAQERGVLFITPGEKVYEGQVVGQNAKPEDLEVNICKEKRLSNMRSKGDGVAEALKTPR